MEHKFVDLEALKYFLEKFKEMMANNGPAEEDNSDNQSEDNN